MATTELSKDELAAALAQLPYWQLVTSPALQDPSRQRAELYRSFVFSSFEDAMAFMTKAVPLITQLDHHPRWENSWRTVSVWLTTWDAGHRPSSLDIQLAQQLELLSSECAVRA